MPKEKETSNHPCHFLSLPSARRFWCRHCMSVFEDAITRWRHSRTCRYGVVSNFMRRRELEAKALQNTNKPNPIEARLEQSVEEEAIPPVEENTVNAECSSSSQNHDNKQGDKGSQFRCFICQSQFSSMEEMRHHVKFPCNHKKTVAEENQSTMTVYIDEFTDRSRPWDPAPQPQQEEVYTSEFVPSIDAHHQAIQSNLEMAAEQEEQVVAAPATRKQENITPTNIYVNEQGETVIEVENLDLNSEGGELSLAHLLTQLSQQGIVFDKSKTGQMQARQEMTVSDPSSGKVYTTASTLNYSSMAPGECRDDDEGQPTAEDAANTLAQLAGFRGFRNSQEIYDGTQIVQNQLKSEPHIMETGQGYDYSAAVSAEATSNVDSVQVRSNQPTPLKVNYQYEYYPSTQATSTKTEEHVTIRPVIQSGAQEYNDNVKVEEEIVHQFPVHIYEDRSSAHEVTYITTQDVQQTGAASMQALEGVEGQRVVIGNGAEPVIIQQYANGDPATQQFVNFPVQLPAAASETETQQAAQDSFLHDHPHSGLAQNITGASEEVLPSAEVNLGDGHTLGHRVEVSVSEGAQVSTSNPDISELASTDEKESESNGDEFTIQTVSLQEIVEAETSNPLAFVDKGTVLPAQNNVSGSQVMHSVDGSHLHAVTLESSNNASSLIHNVGSVGNLIEGTSQPDIALADKFVMSTDQRSLEETASGPQSATAAGAGVGARPDRPLFVVSSSGLQLVSADSKSLVTEAPTGL